MNREQVFQYLDFFGKILENPQERRLFMIICEKGGELPINNCHSLNLKIIIDSLVQKGFIKKKDNNVYRVVDPFGHLILGKPAVIDHVNNYWRDFRFEFQKRWVPAYTKEEWREQKRSKKFSLLKTPVVFAPFNPNPPWKTLVQRPSLIEWADENGMSLK